MFRKIFFSMCIFFNKLDTSFIYKVYASKVYFVLMLKPIYRNKHVVSRICDSFDQANEGIPQRKPVTQLPILKCKFPNMFS